MRAGVVITLFFLLVTVALHWSFIVSGRIVYYNPTDTIFHLTRIVGLQNVGQSPVNFAVFAHHGTPMNIFYPWLTLYPAYWLYTWSGSLVWAYHIFCALTTFVTLGLSYWAFYTINPRRDRALIFAVLYALNPYRFSDLIARGAIGELLGMTFLPLVFIGLGQILRGDRQYWYLLALGMALTANTHNLTLFMNTTIVIIALLWAWPRMTDKKARLLALAKAAAAALLLSLPTILTTLQWVTKNALMIPTAHQVYAQNPWRLLIATLTTDTFKNTIGLLFFLLLIGLLASWHWLQRTDRWLLVFAAIMIWANTTWFPWSLFSRTPFLELQFAFRLNMYVAVILSYIAAKNVPLWRTKTWRTGLAILALAGLLVGSHVLTTNAAYSQRRTGESVLTDKTLTWQVPNYDHHDYGNLGYKKHPKIIDRNIFKLHNQRAWPRNTITPNRYTIRIQNNSDRPAVFTIPVYHYSSQQVRLNGHRTRSELNDSGTTDVLIPVGRSTIELSYQYGNVTKVSVLIALLTLVLLPVLIRRRII